MTVARKRTHLADIFLCAGLAGVLSGCGAGGLLPDSGSVVDSGTDASFDVRPDPGLADLIPFDSIGDSYSDASHDLAVDVEAFDFIDDAGDSADSVDSTYPDIGYDASDATELTCPAFDNPIVLSRLGGTDLKEISGLAASRIHDNLLWAHNDSGDSARIFAIVPEPAETPGSPRVSSISIGSGGESWGCLDWEDIAVGPFGPDGASHIFVADSGANGCTGRTLFRLFIVAEPLVSNETSIPQVTVVTYEYEDGPHDCEAIFVDPVDGAVYFVVKEERIKTSGVYRLAPEDLVMDGELPVTAMLVATIPGQLVTGADMSADGRTLVIRNYGGQKIDGTSCGGLLFQRRDGDSVQDMLNGRFCLLPDFSADPWVEIQGEAIAISPDVDGVFTAPEYIDEYFEEMSPQLLRFWPFPGFDDAFRSPFRCR